MHICEIIKHTQHKLKMRLNVMDVYGTYELIFTR